MDKFRLVEETLSTGRMGGCERGVGEVISLVEGAVGVVVSKEVGDCVVEPVSSE